MKQWTMNMLIGHNLRLARELRGLTQEQAAQALARQQRAKPWSKATWSAAEHSVDGQVVRQFSGDDLVDLGAVFDLPPVWFLLPPGSDYEPVEILATSRPDDAEEYGLVPEILSYVTQERLLAWLTRPSVEVVSRLRRTGFAAYAQSLDGTPTERLLEVSDQLRGVIRLIEEATGVVTVERSDGSTVRMSKEEDDRERRASLEGHRESQELAKGEGFPSQEEADRWAEQQGYTVSRTPVQELSPAEVQAFEEATEQALADHDETERTTEPKKPRKTTPARRRRPA